MKILKRRMVNFFLALMSKYWTRVEKAIPKVELEYKHLKNANLLKDRSMLLEYLPKQGVVAELGVNNGDFSEKILSINHPNKLHLIDAWESKRYNQEKREKVEKRFDIENNVIINVGRSTDVVNDFPNHYFDWIYIDTDHGYDVTIKELVAYLPKIKRGGIIAGHDFIKGNWQGMVRYGVIEAVFEFFKKYNWEILYLTAENKDNPSFAIRGIAS